MFRQHKEQAWRDLVRWYADENMNLRNKLEREQELATRLAYVSVNQKHKPVITCLCDDCQTVRDWCNHETHR